MEIHSFDDLQSWAEAFAIGEFSSMIVIGRRGLAKTTTFMNGLEKELGPSDGMVGAPWQAIAARLSAFELFRQAYLFKDKPILIDDVDALLRDAQTVALLKSLLQDEVPRRVSWFSAAVGGESTDIPHTFFTSSPVAILANDIGSVNANLEAVLDRAKVIEFLPPVGAVLAQAGTWFDDEEVLRFVREWEPWIGNGRLTMRQLKHASDLRKSTRVRMDWQGELLKHWGITPGLIAASKVRMNPALKTRPAKLAEFQRFGGSSKSEMYRLLKELETRTPEVGA